MNKQVRVRFAPSPTGPLHIGGVRTALYNYLFARHHHGKFILRIEDTDQTRYVPGAEEYIQNSLQWLGLNYDEGPGIEGPYSPYRQSERKSLYKDYALQLVEKGLAYYAFDTADELNTLRSDFESRKETFKYDATTRMSCKNSLSLTANEVNEKLQNSEPYVIRVKIPENREIIINDMIRGKVVVKSSVLDDKVLFKSDGLPTYHLANVVDDHLMEITHVIRGEEWLPSAPLHVLLYEFLGWTSTQPQFAHMPLIMKPVGKGKLSKRDGDVGGFPVFPLEWTDPESKEKLSGYREAGYFPEAVINILAFLGWNPGTDKEVYSLEELIRDFTLERVGKSGAKFDPDKAKWYNHQYLQQKPDESLLVDFKEILRTKNIDSDDHKLLRILSLIKERAHFTSELWDLSSYFFEAPESYEPKVVKKRWKENTPALMTQIADLISACEDFTSKALEETFKKFIEGNDLGFGAVMNPLRLCLVGGAHGAHLFDIMEIIGKEESLKRVEKGLNEIKRG